MSLQSLHDFVAQVEKKTKIKTKPKKTGQKTIHLEHVTNLSPFDKSMIAKSEDMKGK